MSTIPNFNCYGLVIDTDQYAGNFEREMCAFLTGHTGDCGVGDNYITEDLDDDLFGNVISVPDEHGCYRPVSIYPVKNGNRYNAVMIFFDSIPTQEQINSIKERSELFAEYYRGKRDYHSNFKLNILGFRLIQFLNSTQESDL